MQRFNQLLAELWPLLVSWAYAILHKRHDAEDVAQDAALKLWQASFNPTKGTVAALARVIVVHEAIDLLRRSRRPQ